MRFGDLWVGVVERWSDVVQTWFPAYGVAEADASGGGLRVTGARPLPDDVEAEVHNLPVAAAEGPVVPPNAADGPLLNAKAESRVANPLHWHPAHPTGKTRTRGEERVVYTIGYAFDSGSIE